MRIDLVFPRFKLLSGAERLILEYAAALARAGHRPRIVCHRFDESCRPLLADGVELAVSGRRLDFFHNRYLNAILDYAAVLGLTRWLDRGAEARVLFGPALILAWRLRTIRRERIPLVYHCYEPPRVLYQDRDSVLSQVGALRWLLGGALSLYRRVDQRLVGAVDGISTAGPFAKRRVEAIYGRDATSITHGIVRAPLDAARSAATPREHALVTVNYLHPRKRVDMIIRALALVDQKVAPILEIVGDGPERPALEKLACELGLRKRVRFAGFVPEQDLAQHYCRAWCYVHATREETFGLSILEAAYCGLPVVSVAEGGPTDNVLDGVTGVLVPSTPEGLARGIDAVLTRPDRGAAMGQRGRQRAAELCDWDRGARELVSLIEAAL